MDNIQKFLKKLTPKEREVLLWLITKIIALDLKNLDIKKLTNHEDLYRVRKGKFRVIFRKETDRWVLLDINYRWDAYKWL